MLLMLAHAGTGPGTNADEPRYDGSKEARWSADTKYARSAG
jgi:hypothetical protein